MQRGKDEGVMPSPLRNTRCSRWDLSQVSYLAHFHLNVEAQCVMNRGWGGTMAICYSLRDHKHPLFFAPFI
jgi:hypothetical protein